jgi:hypothetical protein
MANFPGPYELEFVLSLATTPAREHVIRQNIALVGSPVAGTPFASITVQKQGGGTANLQTAADLLWSFHRLMHATIMTVVNVILWKYVTGTFAKDFVSSGTVATPSGVTGSAQEAQQHTLSFRTANGGIMKLVYLEGNVAGNSRLNLVPNTVGTNFQKVAAYVLSADNICLGRDDSYPVAALRESRGQNERVWRSIHR